VIHGCSSHAPPVDELRAEGRTFSKLKCWAACMWSSKVREVTTAVWVTETSPLRRVLVDNIPILQPRRAIALLVAYRQCHFSSLPKRPEPRNDACAHAFLLSPLAPRCRAPARRRLTRIGGTHVLAEFQTNVPCTARSTRSHHFPTQPYQQIAPPRSLTYSIKLVDSPRRHPGASRGRAPFISGPHAYTQPSRQQQQQSSAIACPWAGPHILRLWEGEEGRRRCRRLRVRARNFERRMDGVGAPLTTAQS
jgi:hypothetical protein